MACALIAGCGFVGQATGRMLLADGWDVTGVTRSEQTAAALTAGGLRTVACDISDPELVRAKLGGFAAIDAIVDCVSSGRGGEEAYRRNYLQGARTLLDILHPQRFLFTGSTSVYAQNDGSTVTEESAAPSRETGRILRETEELALGYGGIVVRLAGIYGPGRWVLLRKFLDGSATIEGDGSRWINQIHRDDAASAIRFLLNNATAPGIYNVADDTPLTQLDCHRLFSSRFGKPLPPSGPADPERKRGVTNKRVSNAKLRALGWMPKFPSMKEALHDDLEIIASLDDGTRRM